MKTTDFEYDGVLASDYSFMVCSFDDGGTDTIEYGSAINFDTVSMRNGKKFSLINSGYDDAANFTFQICKDPSVFNDSEMYFTIEEQRKVYRWLNRNDGYHELKIFTDDFGTIVFNGSFNISAITLNTEVVGFELSFQMEAPYATQNRKVLRKKFNRQGSFTLIDESDDIGYIYPHLQITCKNDGDLKIHNSVENRTTVIKNCKSGEVIWFSVCYNFSRLKRKTSSEKWRETMKIIKKYKHFLPVVVYGIFYLKCFQYLETHITKGYHLIHTPFDDMIPFCEFFVIPYFMWFGYIAWSVLYFGFCNKNRREYYQLIINLGIGMTAFLVISYLYPNGQNLRPTVFPRENIFTDLVRGLYLTDTPTNVFPSIHVYNSVAVAVAVEHSEQLKNRPVFRNVCLGLTVLIVFSTMFLKQHSVSDVCCALVMNAGTCMLLYRPAKAGNALRTREKKAKYRM